MSNTRENDRAELFAILERLVADNYGHADIMSLVEGYLYQAEDIHEVCKWMSLDIEAKMSPEELAKRETEVTQHVNEMSDAGGR